MGPIAHTIEGSSGVRLRGIEDWLLNLKNVILYVGQYTGKTRPYPHRKGKGETARSRQGLRVP